MMMMVKMSRHEGRIFHVDSEEKSTLAIVIVCIVDIIIANTIKFTRISRIIRRSDYVGIK